MAVSGAINRYKSAEYVYLCGHKSPEYDYSCGHKSPEYGYLCGHKSPEYGYLCAKNDQKGRQILSPNWLHKMCYRTYIGDT